MAVTVELLHEEQFLSRVRRKFKHTFPSLVLNHTTFSMTIYRQVDVIPFPTFLESRGTQGRESFFKAYGDILFFNFFLTSIVHYNLSEVEEHDLAVLPHSMYSLLEAKDKFCLIFQQREKKIPFPPISAKNLIPICRSPYSKSKYVIFSCYFFAL